MQVKRQDCLCSGGSIRLLLSDGMAAIGNDCAERTEAPNILFTGSGDAIRRMNRSRTIFYSEAHMPMPEREFVPPRPSELTFAQRACDTPSQ